VSGVNSYEGMDVNGKTLGIPSKHLINLATSKLPFPCLCPFIYVSLGLCDSRQVFPIFYTHSPSKITRKGGKGTGCVLSVTQAGFPFGEKGGGGTGWQRRATAEERKREEAES